MPNDKIKKENGKVDKIGKIGAKVKEVSASVAKKGLIETKLKQNKKIVKAVAKKAKISAIKVMQIASSIAIYKNQKLSLRGLGLKKVNDVVEVEDTPSNRGMINKVKHLVKII